MRKITLPAGIGDGLWVLQKLVNTGEKFDFFIPDSSPRRGKPLYDLLPQVANSCTYKAGLSYKILAKNNIQNKRKLWEQIKENSFSLSMNAHLEAGRRIEEFLPDLPVSFQMEYATTNNDVYEAALLLPASPKYIGIYGSAYKNARHQHYNGYGPHEWFNLIKLLYKGNKDFVFVIIGAEYDTDLATMLMELLKEYNIPFVNAMCRPLGVTIEILKRLFYFIGFPSGLSILNESLGKDGTMFYGHKIAKIINTWADPERIKNGNIKECLFCEPEKIYDWLKQEYKIFDR